MQKVTNINVQSRTNGLFAYLSLASLNNICKEYRISRNNVNNKIHGMIAKPVSEQMYLNAYISLFYCNNFFFN